MDEGGLAAGLVDHSMRRNQTVAERDLVSRDGFAGVQRFWLDRWANSSRPQHRAKTTASVTVRSG